MVTQSQCDQQASHHLAEDFVSFNTDSEDRHHDKARKGVTSLMVYKELLKARGDGNETKP